MNSLDNNTLAIVAIVAVVLIVAIALVGWSAWRTSRLKKRFGPEYDAVLHRTGSKAKAEKELLRREKRVQHFQIVPLSAADVAKFSNSWSRVQGSFVDDPKGVLIEADKLVRELLVKRGYPVADFELRAADISVDHPIVVNNYRAAQRIVSLDQRGEASTEDMRKAVVHFRALFDELLGTVRAHDAVTPPKPLAA